MEYSERIKRGTGRYCLYIYKWIATLRWTDCCYWDKAVMQSHTIESWTCWGVLWIPNLKYSQLSKKRCHFCKNMTNICWGKSSGTILLTSSNSWHKLKRYLQNTKSTFYWATHTYREKLRGKIFFSQKTDRKNSIMVPNNNSRVIPTTNRQGVNNRDMVGITAPQQTFNRHLNPGKPIQWELKKVHPLIKRLFSSKSIADVRLAGRLKHFVGSWFRIIKDPNILDTVKGYKILFYSKTYQSKICSQRIVSQ